MQRQGEGIILQASPYGEGGAIVSLLSAEFGVISGLLRGATRKKADLAPANIVHFTHKKRLVGQLGTFQVERFFSPAVYVYDDFLRLQILRYQCEVIHALFHEDIPNPRFYEKTLENFKKVASKKETLERLALWELDVLSAVGFAPSLSKEDAVPCPEGSPLYYVSPRTGRAVPKAVGLPYHSRLLLLPKFLGGQEGTMLDVFRLTGHFLEHAFSELAPRKTLQGRLTLMEYIKTHTAEQPTEGTQ